MAQQQSFAVYLSLSIYNLLLLEWAQSIAITLSYLHALEAWLVQYISAAVLQLSDGPVPQLSNY